jgi:hypothetical protein
VGSRNPGPSFDDLLRAQVIRIIREDFGGSIGAAFPWVPLAAAGLTPKSVKHLARSEGVRLTRIGKAIRVHRDDLDALAARNAIDASKPATAIDDATIDPLAGVAPAVASAFRRAASGESSPRRRSKRAA